MTDMHDVKDKVVMITGGSRSLGRALALAFASRGAKLVIASRKLDPCEQFAQQLRAQGSEALALAYHIGEWRFTGASYQSCCRELWTH